MSAPIRTEWPCQQYLNIREIKRTPVPLIKFPLQIAGLNYESPWTSPDIELVETESHLYWLVEKYELFLAKQRLARLSYSPTASSPRPTYVNRSATPNDLELTCVEYAYYVAPGMPGASDKWLVPKPYDPLVNTHTERLPVSSTPTTATLTAHRTPVQSSDEAGTRPVWAGRMDYVAASGLNAGRSF